MGLDVHLRRIRKNEEQATAYFRKDWEVVDSIGEILDVGVENCELYEFECHKLIEHLNESKRRFEAMKVDGTDSNSFGYSRLKNEIEEFEKLLKDCNPSMDIITFYAWW